VDAEGRLVLDVVQRDESSLCSPLGQLAPRRSALRSALANSCDGAMSSAAASLAITSTVGLRSARSIPPM